MKKHMNECSSAELRDKMSSAVRYLENHLPRGDGPRGNSLVVLLASGTFEPGVAQYAANCSRENIVALLRETADRLERQEDTPREPG